ncbi:LLM class F420-dependent oxidoreductase [Mycobacterium colombiense]|uniref:TIGR03617 family F420-dependent LLM class oxidoreductase n=1 Tax=Mycobacterium colombiense TaxID=339268 RepID=UPI0007F01F06|nr:TIGR03617 family F420-dependent LLM class oxidoreductase [Mycobacterium colombiense]OBK63100.1 LLM class F420-dependent oxidoreductase [Mycobacterium colombiense]
MKIDARLTWSGPAPTTADFADQASASASAGYDALWSAESAHDPFIPLPTVAAAAPDLQIGTAIAVAFARNPMSLAYTAHDIQLLSGGRFMLGLGSQVCSHITRRFDMPWSSPAARMHEFVAALHAIWKAWNEDAKLDFDGQFYRHTLMTPFFSPPPSEFGPPKVYLAAVGGRMTEVAGHVCDGLMPHPFTTLRYLRERTVPALQVGLHASRRSLADFSIAFQGLIATGHTEEEMAAAIRRVREQIAFYGSTPTYHPVLELHGWEELAHELTTLSKSDDPQRWTRMGDLIDDEVLAEFALVAEPDLLGKAIHDRFGGLVDRFNFYAPYQHDSAVWRPAIEYLSHTTA